MSPCHWSVPALLLPTSQLFFISPFFLFCSSRLCIGNLVQSCLSFHNSPLLLPSLAASLHRRSLTLPLSYPFIQNIHTHNNLQYRRLSRSCRTHFSFTGTTASSVLSFFSNNSSSELNTLLHNLFLLFLILHNFFFLFFIFLF